MFGSLKADLEDTLAEHQITTALHTLTEHFDQVHPALPSFEPALVQTGYEVTLGVHIVLIVPFFGFAFSLAALCVSASGILRDQLEASIKEITPEKRGRQARVRERGVGDCLWQTFKLNIVSLQVHFVSTPHE